MLCAPKQTNLKHHAVFGIWIHPTAYESNQTNLEHHAVFGILIHPTAYESYQTNLEHHAVFGIWIHPTAYESYQTNLEHHAVFGIWIHPTAYESCSQYIQKSLDFYWCRLLGLQPITDVKLKINKTKLLWLKNFLNERCMCNTTIHHDLCIGNLRKMCHIFTTVSPFFSIYVAVNEDLLLCLDFPCVYF